MRSHIRETLELIGAIDSSRLELLSDRTRDRIIPVYRDPETEVVFIDDFFVGLQEYRDGSFRPSNETPSYEDELDTRRRVDSLRQYFYGRDVLDFGCGKGSFLRGIIDSVSSGYGVELHLSSREALIKDGIPCFEELASVPTHLDAAFMFHVLEHLPNPIEVLQEVREHLKPDVGLLVVEVPHARDFLITDLKSRPFIEATLWSQHLVLHTRESLARLLRAAGFRSVRIQGVQRYGLANHLTWLAHGKPGGHRDPLASIESHDLNAAYGAALAARDRTDTLLAFAH